jgi:hypothetical protein
VIRVTDWLCEMGWLYRCGALHFLSMCPVNRFWDRVESVSALFLGKDRGRWGCEEHAEICYRSRACGVHVKNIGWRRSVMHAVIRSYSGKGTKALFDLLEKNKGEVESLIRG